MLCRRLPRNDNLLRPLPRNQWPPVMRSQPQTRGPPQNNPHQPSNLSISLPVDKIASAGDRDRHQKHTPPPPPLFSTSMGKAPLPLSRQTVLNNWITGYGRGRDTLTCEEARRRVADVLVPPPLDKHTSSPPTWETAKTSDDFGAPRGRGRGGSFRGSSKYTQYKGCLSLSS